MLVKPVDGTVSEATAFEPVELGAYRVTE